MSRIIEKISYLYPNVFMFINTLLYNTRSCADASAIFRNLKQLAFTDILENREIILTEKSIIENGYMDIGISMHVWMLVCEAYVICVSVYVEICALICMCR